MQSKKPASPRSTSSTWDTILSLKEHWDNAYKKKATEQLGWYESSPEPSLSLIRKCHLNKVSRLFIAGAGSTTLVDHLLDMGFESLVVNDISKEALDILKSRTGILKQKVNWMVGDLTKSEIFEKIDQVDLWHDRAVLHFFTSEKDQETYFNLVKKLVKPKGYVIIAVFNLEGAPICSGLPLYRYSEPMLSKKLGAQFQLIESFDFIYTMPSGDTRPYVYTLYQRK